MTIKQRRRAADRLDDTKLFSSPLALRLGRGWWSRGTGRVLESHEHVTGDTDVPSTTTLSALVPGGERRPPWSFFCLIPFIFFILFNTNRSSLFSSSGANHHVGSARGLLRSFDPGRIAEAKAWARRRRVLPQHPEREPVAA